jgi:hypothetical protein
MAEGGCQRRVSQLGREVGVGGSEIVDADKDLNAGVYGAALTAKFVANAHRVRVSAGALVATPFNDTTGAEAQRRCVIAIHCLIQHRRVDVAERLVPPRWPVCATDAVRATSDLGATKS